MSDLADDHGLAISSLLAAVAIDFIVCRRCYCYCGFPPYALPAAYDSTPPVVAISRVHGPNFTSLPDLPCASTFSWSGGTLPPAWRSRVKFWLLSWPSLRRASSRHRRPNLCRKCCLKAPIAGTGSSRDQAGQAVSGHFLSTCMVPTRAVGDNEATTAAPPITVWTRTKCKRAPLLTSELQEPKVICRYLFFKLRSRQVS